MKKRILQLTGSFHNGGTERQAAALTTGLAAADMFEMHLATLNREGVLRSDVEAAGFDNVPEFRLTSFLDANFLKQVWRCSHFLRDKKIDLIHTHDFYTNVFGMAAAKLAGTPIKVASKRETGGMRTKSQDALERGAFWVGDRIVANSKAVGRSLTSRGIRREKIEVIYNGVDVDRFGSGSPTRRDLRLPENRRLITLVANLRHEVKNVPMLLRSAARVTAAVDGVDFVVAGEGELEGELRSLASHLGIADRTHFVGRCDDVPSLLTDSFACVLTSTHEGFSNSLIEYMAAGRPVVATNVGGAAEAVDAGTSGYLVDRDDDTAMADRLLELLKDPSKAEEFGVQGRRVVIEKFSRQAQVEKTVALYDKLLGN